MKTGQSTTSFHPATGNPIMTSTTYNRSVAHATDESKTKPSKESHGAILDLIRGRGHNKGNKSPGINKGGSVRKGVGVRLLLALNDLLPRKVRIVKSRRARYKRWYGWRTYILAIRINWRSIYKNKLMNKLGLRHGSNKK
jgi:hypothetical protein